MYNQFTRSFFRTTRSGNLCTHIRAHIRLCSPSLVVSSMAHGAHVCDMLLTEQRTPGWDAMLRMTTRNQAAYKGGPHAAMSHAACVASVMLWSRGLAPDVGALPDINVSPPSTDPYEVVCDADGLDAAQTRLVHNVDSTVRQHVPRVKQCVASQELWCVLSQWLPCALPRIEVHPATQKTWLVVPRPRAQSRVRKPDVVELAIHATQQGIDRVVVLMPNAAAFNHHCRQAVRDAQDESHEGTTPIVFEVIEYAQLCGIKPLHVLVPAMRVVDKSQEQDTLAKWAAPGTAQHNAKDSVPSMLSSDAIARWFAWPQDTLVQYTARLGHGTAAFPMVRRVVEENTASATYSASGERKRASGWIIV